jgi:hypothetical protein
MTYADRMCSFAWSEDELRLPEDEGAGLDVPGRHQDPTHFLPLLHAVGVTSLFSCTEHLGLITM